MATLLRGPIDTTASVDDVADKIPVDHMTGYDSLEGKRELLEGLDGLRDEEILWKAIEFVMKDI